MKTIEICEALRGRFAPPQYAIAFEVRNGTGFKRTREAYADAIAMSLWPSRGLELIGFEIKAARGDWLSELKNPAKAEEISRFCDRWYIVAGDDEIVKPGELPATWGLIVPRGKKLHVKHEAPKLPAESVDRLFLASLLRAAATQAPSERAIRIRIEKTVAAEREQSNKLHTSVMRGFKEDKEKTQKAIDDFEQVSGIRISTWNGGRIGDAAKFILDGGLHSLETRLRNIGDEATRIQKAAIAAATTYAKPDERVTPIARAEPGD